MGTRESLNGRKNMARRKVKNGEKSPWGQCLTRPVPTVAAVLASDWCQKNTSFFPRPLYLPLGLRGCIAQGPGASEQLNDVSFVTSPPTSTMFCTPGTLKLETGAEEMSLFAFVFVVE